ncbi:MAG: ATP-grasp domain-containing protein [Syntrophobacteraceae bacterium]
MEDETQILIAKNRDLFSKYTRLFLADHECLEIVQDKLNVMNRARSLGIPIPETFDVPDLETGMSLMDRLPYPVVVKPRVGAGGAGLEYVNGPGELPAALRRAADRGGPFLVQERLPGDGRGMGASFLMDGSQKVLASFVHERLREYPVTGGPSTLRQSVVSETVREQGERLLRSFGFRGVAMVELKVDSRDGTPKLLEVNARPWGSMALAVDAGVNFPYLLTLAALGIPFEPVTRYKVGHRTRWLLPGDLLHFIHNPDRFHLEPSFFRFNEPNFTYDIIDPKDPWPIIGAILSLWPYFRSPAFEHVRRRR